MTILQRNYRTITCKGTILQRNYRKMTMSFSYNFFVKFHGEQNLGATICVLYSNPYYNKVCFKGTALYHSKVCFKGTTLL